MFEYVCVIPLYGGSHANKIFHVSMGLSMAYINKSCRLCHNLTTIICQINIFFLVTFVNSSRPAYLLFDRYHAVSTRHQTQFGVALLEEAERTAVKGQQIGGAAE